MTITVAPLFWVFIVVGLCACLFLIFYPGLEVVRSVKEMFSDCSYCIPWIKTLFWTKEKTSVRPLKEFVDEAEKIKERVDLERRLALSGQDRCTYCLTRPEPRSGPTRQKDNTCLCCEKRPCVCVVLNPNLLEDRTWECFENYVSSHPFFQRENSFLIPF
jgi:hypothetical protein